jgi:hypothetical protein
VHASGETIRKRKQKGLCSFSKQKERWRERVERIGRNQRAQNRGQVDIVPVQQSVADDGALHKTIQWAR